MTAPGRTPNIGSLDLSDSDAEDLFASPSAKGKKPECSGKDEAPQASGSQTASKSRNGESRYDSEDAREASLRRELDSVRSINQVMEGVLESLDRAKGNMEVRKGSQ